MVTDYRFRNTGAARGFFKMSLEYVEQMVASNGTG